MRSLTLTLLGLFMCINVHSQTFNSGSTGVDRAFDPPSSVPEGTTIQGMNNQGNCTQNSPCVVTVPLREPDQGEPIHANGRHVFNFTTVNIGPNVTVRFARNVANTPVFILAQGNVTISGSIDVSAQPPNAGPLQGVGGPGGFNGGYGAQVLAPDTIGGAGSGPGAGPANGAGAFATGPSARRYGLPELQLIIGGSGGGGSSRVNPNVDGSRASGGGGAILIASSGTIDLTGGGTFFHAIRANGGNELINNTAGRILAGSGGAIRLVASILRGNRPVEAKGGFGTNGFDGGDGRIRFESLQQLQYSGTSTPQASVLVNSSAFFGTPLRVFPPFTPTLRIVSIGGVALPPQPTAEVSTPDIALPSNFTNPVTIVVEGTNIPSGTPFEIIASPQYGSGVRRFAQGTLTGPVGQVKTATLSVNLPTTGVGIISALIRAPIVPEPSSTGIH